MIKLLIRFKDVLIFCAWIASMLLIISLCWFLTRSLRVNLLQSSVNRVFIENGDTRRILRPDPRDTSVQLPSQIGKGMWFSMNDGNRVLVFSLIADGIFIPCAAIVDNEGKLQELIPLTSSGNKMLNRISPGIINLYARRIEGES